MQFTIDSDKFKKALDILNFIIPSKPSHPVLGCLAFQIQAEFPNILEISAFDLELGLEIKLDIEDGKPGNICIPAKLLLENIAKQEGALFCQDTQDNALLVKSSSGKFSLRGMAGDEFPDLWAGEWAKNPILIESNLLFHCLEACQEMASREETKQELRAINIQGRSYDEGECLIISATDGHKAGIINLESEIDMDFPEPEEGKDYALGINLNLPARAISLLNRIHARHPSDSLEVIPSISDNLVIFNQGKFKILCRLISGKFPDVSGLFPREFSYEIQIDKKALIHCLDRLSIACPGKTKMIDIILNEQKQALELSSPPALEISGNEYLECAIKSPAGSPNLKISLNPDLMKSGLSTLVGAEVLIQLNSGHRPIQIEPMLCDFDHKILVMPIQKRE